MKRVLITAFAVTTSFAHAQVLPAALDCQVDYAFVRSQVFEGQCLSCHSGAKIKAGVDLSTFAEAVKHLSKIETVVKNDEMPPTSSLAPHEAEIVLAWIAQGGQEVAPQESVCVPQ
jgi:mono/diheme cytochrome c family protein